MSPFSLFNNVICFLFLTHFSHIIFLVLFIHCFGTELNFFLKEIAIKILKIKQAFVIAPKDFIKILRIFYVNIAILLAKTVMDLD
jgi:hypothetical protein